MTHTYTYKYSDHLVFLAIIQWPSYFTSSSKQHTATILRGDSDPPQHAPLPDGQDHNTVNRSSSRGFQSTPAFLFLTRTTTRSTACATSAGSNTSNFFLLTPTYSYSGRCKQRQIICQPRIVVDSLQYLQSKLSNYYKSNILQILSKCDKQVFSRIRISVCSSQCSQAAIPHTSPCIRQFKFLLAPIQAAAWKQHEITCQTWIVVNGLSARA